jgi:hypothetical protein
MANGIMIIDKPPNWTASEHALMERACAAAHALILPGGSSFSRHARSAGPHREDRGN